jgi:hypothetical protein
MRRSARLRARSEAAAAAVGQAALRWETLPDAEDMPLSAALRAALARGPLRLAEETDGRPARHGPFSVLEVVTQRWEGAKGEVAHRQVAVLTNKHSLKSMEVAALSGEVCLLHRGEALGGTRLLLPPEEVFLEDSAGGWLRISDLRASLLAGAGGAIGFH